MSNNGFQPGDVLGDKYRLTQLVGEGGMGQVWLARHELLDRDCAVKVLSRGPGRRDVKDERFAREAKIAASLRHKNVVDLFDFGEADSGDFFMVMEWLEGESLAERLKRSPALPLRELVTILCDSLAGLAAVHERGIVHRDLKPENIFLSNEDGEVIPKLLDFGVSRLRRGLEGASLTGTGSTVGTPHYMSCEQVRGARDLDGRADLYSIGVILYRATVGHFPFEAEELTELLLSVANQAAPRLVPLHLEVGESLSAVIDRALERDRNQRFRNAAEMRRALLASADSVSSAVPCQWRRGENSLPFDSPTSDASNLWANSSRQPSGGALSHLRLRRQWRRAIPMGLAALVVVATWLLLAQ